MIVATELTTSDEGAGLEVKETFDEQPETVLADAGYAMNGTCRHSRRAAGAWRRGARARGR